MENIKYFNGNIELRNVFPVDSQAFEQMGGRGCTGGLFDGFECMAGYPAGTTTADPKPVTRAVRFRATKRPHKCDARCMGATGQLCECACGGRNHGVNA